MGVEQTAYGESSFGKEWMLFGQDLGLKALDLMHINEALPSGVRTVPGVCIGASYYDAFLQENNLSLGATSEEVYKAKLTKDLQEINKQLLSFIPLGTPIIVRSSAREERGGNGIYDSLIYVITGDKKKDLKELSSIERSIYGSYHSEKAVLFRGNQDAALGMGLLIQPLVGDVYGESFMPLLSGVFTLVNNEPTLRLVMGLGTKAVSLDDALVFQGKSLDVAIIESALRFQKKVDTFDMRASFERSKPWDFDLLEQARKRLPLIQNLIDGYRLLDRQDRPQYWEFAIDQTHEDVFLVQANDIARTESFATELEAPIGAIVCEGTDVVNTGKKQGRGVVWVGKGGFEPNMMKELKRFNARHKAFVLIAPDRLFSGGGPLQISFEHFSNATAVIELQLVREPELESDTIFTYSPTIDHQKGRGGTHFAGICTSKDILFLGTQVTEWNDDMVRVLGDETDKVGSFIKFWDVEFIVANASHQGRMEILGEPTRREFKEEELRTWLEELHGLIDFENALATSEIAEPFSKLFDCLLKSRSSLDGGGGVYDFVQEIGFEEAAELLDPLDHAKANLFILDSYDLFYRFAQYAPEKETYPLELYVDKLTEKLWARIKQSR